MYVCTSKTTALLFTLLLGELEYLWRHALIHAGNQIKEPCLAIALLGVGNALYAGIVKVLLLGAILVAGLTERRNWVDDFFSRLTKKGTAG
jgi:hypothetical protein